MSSYIGQSPVFGDFPFQILTGNGGASYTINYKVSNENGMLVFLNGAIQRPGVDYTAGGSTLAFAQAIPVGVQIFTYGMGLPKSTLSTSAGGVGLAELAAGVYANDADAQGFSNSTKIITPHTLATAFKGSNQSLNGSGFQKVAGGLIWQWATFSAAPSGADNLFPIAFPNSVFSVAISPTTSTNTTPSVSIGAVTRLGFKGFSAAGNFYYIAVGF